MKEQASLDNIIKQCQAGRPQAFETLLDLYGPRLYAYFIRASGSAPDADDLMQDIFVKIIENIKKYQHQNKFEHWLFRIAANLAHDRIRTMQRHPTVSLDQQPDNDTPNRTASLADTAPAPDADIELNEQKQLLEKALQELSPTDRAIILARHHGQMSFKEIAQQFQLPIGTALAKVHRGLKTLRKWMTNYEIETE